MTRDRRARRQHAPLAAVGLAALVALAGCGTTSPQAGAAAGAADGPLPASPMGHYLAGRFAPDQRDLAAAADLLSVALAADPGNADLLRETYLATVSDGRMAEAAGLAQRLVDAGVEETPARLTLALKAVKAGDMAGARDQLARMKPEGFNTFVIPMLESWVLLGAEGVDAALAHVEPLGDFRGLEPVRGVQAGLIADIGGQRAVADASFASAMQAGGPPPYRMVEIVGNYYQRSGRHDEALKLYQEFIDANAGSVLARAMEARRDDTDPAPAVAGVADGLAEVLFDAASILRQENVTDVALIYVRMALDLRPDLAIARLLLADVLDVQGRKDGAMQAYSEVPRESPLSWQARLSLADLLDQSDRTAEAIALLEQMVDEQPDQVDPPMQLGNLYRIHERFGEAARAYDVAVARLGDTPPADRWPLFYFRGIANERNGDWPQAEADFMKALELSPDHPYVLNYLAYSWIEQGLNYDRALEMLKQAVSLRPGDGFVVDSLGWVYYRLGQYDLAVEQLERANELLPTDPVLNDHLGDAYWRVGRHVEARFQWRRALQFGPDADLVPPIEAKIENGLGAAEPLPPDAAAPSGG